MRNAERETGKRRGWEMPGIWQSRFNIAIVQQRCLLYPTLKKQKDQQKTSQSSHAEQTKSFPSHQTATPDSQDTDPRLWPEISGWRCRVRPPQPEKADMAKAEKAEEQQPENLNQKAADQKDHYCHPKKTAPQKKKSAGGGFINDTPTLLQIELLS